MTGGEPLSQPVFTAALLRAVRLREVRTVVETCGHVPWTDLARVLPFVDQFRFDVKHVDPLVHRRLTGAGNQVILANLKHLAAAGARVVVRMPLVPGCNADAESVLAVAELARRLLFPELHLVPYHRRGERKYLALGRGYPLDGAVPLSEEVVQEAAAGRREGDGSASAGSALEWFRSVCGGTFAQA